MIKNASIMMLMAVVTLAVSYLMIPRPREIALMQLKSKDFDTAQASYEAQLSEGDYSVSVVIPLSEVYIHKGDIDRAITLLEAFLDREPKHVTGLWRLAQYFKEAQKPHGRARVLARMADVQPDQKILRTLANHHDLLVDDDGTASALARLVEMREATPGEYDRLARHQAAKGRFRQAEATLNAVRARHPKTTLPKSVELLVSLKLDTGDTLGAVSVANDSLEEAKTPDLGQLLAAVFAENGRPDLALRVLRPQIERHPDNPDLVAAAAQYETRMGDTKAALRRVRKFARTRPLTEALAFDQVALLMAEGAPDTAFDALKRQNPARLPGWLVRTVLARALELGRTDLLAPLSKYLGDPYLAAHPVIAAEIFAAMGNTSEAGIWIEWAARNPSLPHRDRLVLARLYQNVGRPDDALALLRTLATEGGGDPNDVAGLADIYLAADRASDGLAIFENLRKTERTQRVDAAWARLAARSRRAAPVLRWMRRTSGIAPEVLEDIARSAENNRQPALALAAAERAHAIRPGASEARRLARAYAAMGQGEKAKSLFAVLIEDGAALGPRDLAALSVLGAIGHLDTYWASRPGDTPATDKNRWFAALADIRRAAAQAILPRMEKMARAEGGFWLDTYIESARMAGEASRLKGFLKAEAERSNLPPADARKIAAALFDVAPKHSVELYARMAARDPDGWADAYIDTLLALNRTAELVAFLQNEVERPGIAGPARDNRLYALIDAGGPQAAIQTLSRLANAESGHWDFAYEEALVSLGRQDALYDFLAAKTERAGLSAEERNGLAFRLLEGGRKQDAEKNFFALASNAGPREDPVLQLLHLWGPRPEPNQMDWLEQRVQAATGKERRLWLGYLNERGGQDRVIRLVEQAGYSGAGGPDRKVYLDAVVALRDTERLRSALRTELSSERRPESLRGLAKLAVQEDLQDVATEAYGALLARRPQDPEAAGWLGRIAYAEGRREDALGLIAITLGKDADNYQSHYIYGELLYADERRNEALPYLRRALELINAVPEPGIEMRLAKGQTLFRLGRTDEAIEVYARLYAERGGDPAIRADYGSLLIDARDLERARAVLWSN
jgi:predicted Zn-dependent protease